MSAEVSITVVTPEEGPLAVFGATASEAVQGLLEEHGVLVISSAHCETPAPGQVALGPGGRVLHVERVVALPELAGPATPGVPKHDLHGFIPIDDHCRVPGLEHVYAAGDATEFPVKHGALAAQQADAAAASIAALAGAPVTPTPFEPVIYGTLLGGDRPLYMRARLAGDRALSSEVGDEPTWSPQAKIVARYLAPYLEARAASR